MRRTRSTRLNLHRPVGLVVLVMRSGCLPPFSIIFDSLHSLPAPQLLPRIPGRLLISRQPGTVTRKLPIFVAYPSLGLSLCSQKPYLLEVCFFGEQFLQAQRFWGWCTFKRPPPPHTHQEIFRTPIPKRKIQTLQDETVDYIVLTAYSSNLRAIVFLFKSYG